MDIKLRSILPCGVVAAGELTLVREIDTGVITPARVVDRQFPEFIRSDYPRMVEFMRVYFDFLAQSENGRIGDLKDIDRTSDNYIAKLRKEFAFNSTKFDFLSDREFIRNAKLFYASKGSEQSIRFLFRALFNQEIQVWYPSERLFKPSAARWVQEKSIKVIIPEESAVPAAWFVGRRVTLRTKSNKEQTIEVTNARGVSVEGVICRYELFFTTELFIPLQYNDSILADGISGTILPSLSSVTIVSPGVDFRVGQTIKLNSGNANGAVAVVTSINSGGALRTIKLISFGRGYTSDFYVTVSAATVDEISDYDPSADLPVDDSTYGYKERMSAIRSDYALNDSPTTPDSPFPLYVAPGYDGVYVVQLSETQIERDPGPDPAVLLCKMGATCSYPGKYMDEVGMPSNISVLQDNDLYQEFSYVIRSNATT